MGEKKWKNEEESGKIEKRIELSKKKISDVRKIPSKDEILERVNNRGKFNRISGLSSVDTIEKLKKVSKSSIINMDSTERIHTFLNKKYNIKLSNFSDMSLDKNKLVFSAFDDMMTKFPEISNVVKEIKYDQKLKHFGITNGSIIRLSNKGLNYETMIHELSHNLDIARGGKDLEYSKNIVDESRKNLKLRKNSKQLSNYRVELTGFNTDEAEKEEEVFAYALETEIVDSKKGNVLSKEIWRLVCLQKMN